MPLNQRKITHMQQAKQKTFARRQQTVILVRQTGSSYAYTSITAIFRKNQQENEGFLITAVDIDFTNVVLVADTATATASGVQNAMKFVIEQVLTAGMALEGTHKLVILRRMR